MSNSLTLYVPDAASVRIIQCSPPSWMALWVSLEKGHRPNLVQLDFAAGEHKTPEMLERNPRGTIPVLEHDGHCVYETLAILSYLDDVLPGPALLPSQPALRARALSLYHTAGELKNRGMAVFAYLMRHAPELAPQTLAELCGDFARELAFWETVVRSHEYLAGEFSLVDCVVYPYLATAHQLGFEFETGLPKLERYRARVAGRAALDECRPRTWRERLTWLTAYSPAAS